jgi:hypothetical protein
MKKDERAKEGVAWLRWHVRDKHKMFSESQDIGTEEHILMKYPSPPQLLQEYISGLEQKTAAAKNVICKFDTYAKMTTTNTGTEREREEHLANALTELNYLVDIFPDMNPEDEDEDEDEIVAWL